MLTTLEDASRYSARLPSIERNFPLLDYNAETRQKRESKRRRKREIYEMLALKDTIIPPGLRCRSLHHLSPLLFQNSRPPAAPRLTSV
ncbi:hypothetical protein Nepgr_020633 [Nepenthes gracilis]|uniref:Uncharacterized protein n=1 Tax=Nepenthes gracilis TaxID=150966 RepID=A0AAD3XV84_NEPGR|nr:hypothetical protein Nepgr_020633 [Nepenthes gracilis]